jgi:L-fucose mutarotase
MLKGIDPLLNADLIYALASMGHGDEIAIVDANFPAAANAKRLIRLDGVDAPRALQAVLSVLPLDSFTPTPAMVMQVVGSPDVVPPAVRDFRAVIEREAGRRIEPLALERNRFYERARSCYAILATGEPRKYGNIILSKGVIAVD